MRLERNLAGFSAAGAHGVVHLAGAAGGFFACVTAGFAALRFVGEPFFGVEFLLARRKGEFLSAILADEGFVVVHKDLLIKKYAGTLPRSTYYNTINAFRQ